MWICCSTRVFYSKFPSAPVLCPHFPRPEPEKCIWVLRRRCVSSSMKYGEVASPQAQVPQAWPQWQPQGPGGWSPCSEPSPLASRLGRMALTALLLVACLLGRTEAMWEGELTTSHNLCSSGGRFLRDHLPAERSHRRQQPQRLGHHRWL